MTIEEYIDGMKRYFSTTSKPNGRHSVDDCCNYNILCSACIFHKYCATGELTLAERAEILEKGSLRCMKKKGINPCATTYLRGY